MAFSLCKYFYQSVAIFSHKKKYEFLLNRARAKNVNATVKYICDTKRYRTTLLFT